MEIDPVCSLLVNREVTLGKRELSMSCRCIGVKKGGGRGGRSWILLISTCLVYTNMKLKIGFSMITTLGGMVIIVAVSAEKCLAIDGSYNTVDSR